MPVLKIGLHFILGTLAQIDPDAVMFHLTNVSAEPADDNSLCRGSLIVTERPVTGTVAAELIKCDSDGRIVWTQEKCVDGQTLSILLDRENVSTLVKVGNCLEWSVKHIG
jgi:hypothetical protein